jgi:hypothetical protein
MKLPAPAYRQAGTPLGREGHGGARSRSRRDGPSLADRAGLAGHVPAERI